MKVSVFLFLIITSVIVISCGKVKNSSSSDAASAASAGGTEEFVSAKQVISDKCLSCHSAWTSYSETDYISKKLVTKKSPSNSTLYTRIRGNDAGVAGDMPEGQSNLSQTDMTTIKTWISSIQ